eukprot:583358-Pyramimonas_sp.AAC.1
MHRSPTEIAHGVSGMAKALKLPPLNSRHAMRTEPKAFDSPPAVFRVFDCGSFRINLIAPALLIYFVRYEVIPTPCINNAAQRSKIRRILICASRSGCAVWALCPLPRPSTKGARRHLGGLTP